MRLSLSDFPAQIFHIKDYGAECSDRLQTEAIQKALDACFLAGGGRVVVPAGIYLTGGLRLRSNTVLYLESGAQLRGSLDPEDYLGFLTDTIEPLRLCPEEESRSVYPYNRWHNGLIRVIDAEKVAIVGEKGACLDGCNCYDPQGEEGYRGPHGISIWHSKDILLEGYAFIHSANWAQAIFASQRITARNLTILGGHDGFDVRTCDDVLVEDCAFYTGDDCVAGFDNNDVVVRNCVLSSACSVMRFGGNHVLVENCRSFAPARYGFRGSLKKDQRAARALTNENCRHSTHTPFKYYCDFRSRIRKTPGDILIRNCTFEGPDAAFQLEFDGQHKWCCNRSLAQIKFENCVFTDLSKPILIHGDAGEPIDFCMEHVTLSAREGFADVPVAELTNFSRFALRDVKITGYTRPALQIYTDGEVVLTDTTPLLKNKIEK